MNIEHLKNRVNMLNLSVDSTQKALKELENQQDKLNHEIENFDRSEYADVSKYDVWLDESGTVNVAGLEYYPSRILAAVDPVAYRCGFNDYVDSMNNEDFEEYKELIEERETLDDEITDLVDEIEDIVSQCEEIKDKIEDLESES